MNWKWFTCRDTKDIHPSRVCVLVDGDYADLTRNAAGRWDTFVWCAEQVDGPSFRRRVDAKRWVECQLATADNREEE